MANATSYYASGAPMWNPKYKAPSLPAAPIKSIPTTLTSVYGITCANVVINKPTLEMSVTTGGNAVIIKIEDIVSIDTQVAIMIIHSDDLQNFTIVFASPADLQSVNSRLATVMNGGADPGCS